MPADDRRRSARVLAGSMLLAAAVAADPAELPPLELLEYLGSIEEADDGWFGPEELDNDEFVDGIFAPPTDLPAPREDDEEAPDAKP